MNFNSIRHCLLLTSLAVAGCDNSSIEQAKSQPKRPVQVMQIGDASKSSEKVFSGMIHSAKTAELSFRVRGTLATIPVKPGQSVQAGQVIATLDPHDSQVAVKELQAQLLAAQSASRLAGIEYQRVKQAYGDNAISAINVDRALSAMQRSDASVNVVAQNLQKARDVLAYTQLTAPFNGVVAKQNVEAFEQIIPGMTIVTLHKPKQLEVAIDVPENLLSQFKIGQSAMVTASGNGIAIAATLKEITTVAHPLKQTYQVTYQLEETATAFLPGQAVKVSSALATKNNHFCVPFSALSGQKNSQHVYLVRNKKIASVAVQVSSLQQNRACLTGKIRAGEQVVVLGVAYLKAGDDVGAMIEQNSAGDLL